MIWKKKQLQRESILSTICKGNLTNILKLIENHNNNNLHKIKSSQRKNEYGNKLSRPARVYQSIGIELNFSKLFEIIKYS